ncbi:MAG: FAD-dependent monooxygenase [Methylotenera sp.]|nr:FAD-dependent monooxygenase [Methylotenera sp.]MDP2403249.1 FAD-dependent monooxygenase [Methylotenera sp.]MDP3095269.1 FAD-dependent monooxygenase [Methylotenera sp.]MDZ4224199.1 FAD-dependent monooxygenase [Methylotenera sp.]
MSTLKVDVTIVGAGLVGLAAAVALNQAGYEVVLVDSQTPPSNENLTEWDQRIYAISPKNAQWLMRLGVWQRLDTSRVTEMHAMEVWGDATPEPLQLLADDVNADNLGFIVEERALKLALMAQVQASGITTLFGHACDSLNASAHQAILHLENQQSIVSTLLLAADGANSWVRQQLGIINQQKPYHQTAIVANFVTEKTHDNIARQWFTQDEAGRSGVMAWLPLPGNKISIVWSAPTQYADFLLKLSASEFAQQVMAVGHSTLGELTLMGDTAAFPLTLKTANELSRNSVVLVGDAVHRVHPMAGQGVNLGFRDVIDLLQILASKHQYQHINDVSLLKQYSRARKTDLLTMLALTNGLYHLFENQNGVVKKVRNWGLSATNQQPIKKMLVANAVAL